MAVAAAAAARGDSREHPHEFDLNITAEQINPDCSDYTGGALLVNQQLPGPAIRVGQGDWVRITVRNSLPAANASNVSGAGLNDVSIHFHGIRQYGSVQADGVPFLTQRPIPPGAEYVHEFRVVNQAGTYFYHAHVGLQEQTVFGPFIIHEAGGPSEKYDDERIITLSEWWHVGRTALEEYFLGPQFKLIPEAQSVLVNGRTLYSTDIPAPESACAGYSIIDVERGRTYRLRIIGASTFRTLGFAVAHHNLTIIEVDGEPTKPYSVPFLEVAPGQRFSVLLHTTQPPRDYTIGTNRRWAEDVSRGSNGMAVLRYHDRARSTRRHQQRRQQQQEEDAPLTRLPPGQPRFPVAETPQWVWSDLQPLHGVDPTVFRPASRTVKLRATDKRMPDGTMRWFINDMAFMEPHTPILADIAQGTRRPPSIFSPGPARASGTGYDPFLGTYPLEYFEIVDFVLQSTHVPGEPCRSHPWHTHGHSHWEIAYGSGEYDDARHGHIRNVPHPLQKDVTLVYPRSDPADDIHGNGTLATDQVGCGWSKIRILADNPGIWAMHCHNAPHMLMGMMVVLEEAPHLISLPSTMRLQ